MAVIRTVQIREHFQRKTVFVEFKVTVAAKGKQRDSLAKKTSSKLGIKLPALSIFRLHLAVEISFSYFFPCD